VPDTNTYRFACACGNYDEIVGGRRRAGDDLHGLWPGA
jgi:hypothetical protein